MRNQLFIIANSLRGLGLSRSESFKRAWAVVRLEELSKTKPVHFAYIKDKGELREAISFNGSEFRSEPKNTDRAPVKPYVRKYWDATSGGYRSFRADRLILA